MEVKAYESEYITDSPDISDEIRRDAILVKRGWEITWLLIDTEPSGPLLKKLLDAGINVEIRLRSGLPVEVVTKLRATKAKVVRER